MDLFIFDIILVLLSWTQTDGAVVNLFTNNLTSLLDTDTDMADRAATNRDNRYAKWLTPKSIPYRLDPSLSAGERSILSQAFTVISSDMNGCIAFTPWTSANANQDHISISRTMNGGSPLNTCFTFPGRVTSQQGRGQKIGMFGGVDGCLNNVRDAMGYLVGTLGLRSELRRPDRDQFLQVAPQNVKPALQSQNLLQVYATTQVDFLNFAFDYHSVTLPSPQKYAVTGTLLYQTAVPGRTIGTLPRLSKGDCQALSILYDTCDIKLCGDPYQDTPLPVVTPAPAPAPAPAPKPAKSPVVVASSIPSLAGLPFPMGP